MLKIIKGIKERTLETTTMIKGYTDLKEDQIKCLKLKNIAVEIKYSVEKLSRLLEILGKKN